MAPYLLPEGLDLDGAAAALAARLPVRAEPARRVAWTFYDTFDGRLHADGLLLRHGDGRLVAIERATGAEAASADSGEAPARLLEGDLPAGALRERLAPVIEMRALTPVARVRGRSRRIAVLNEDDKIVVRLEAEAPEGLRARLTATAVRGYDKDLERVRRVLERDLALEPAATLADEAIERPEGTSSKLDLRLTADQPAGEAAEIVLARLLEIVQANLPGTLDDVDSEFLHDLRVANRRARSLLRQLKSVFPPTPLGRLRDELKRLQQVTGELRDLDVQLLEFEAHADLEPLREVLEQRRARALTATRRELRVARTGAALEDWAALRALPDTPELHAVAGERIAKVYRRMVKMGSAIDEDTEAEALHELRKKGKELRYLLEFFGPLYPADVAKPMVKALKALQDVLGRHQDREVQAETLRGLAKNVAPRPGGAEALMAMGLMIERLAREQADARAEFAAQFADFAAMPRRAAVKATFT
jgi:CHAD domain-containing protein